jgi:hypothetical protein
VVRAGEAAHPTASATVQPDGKQTLVRIRIGDFGPGCRLYGKLSEPTMFFDRAGWREIITPASVLSSPRVHSHQARPEAPVLHLVHRVSLAASDNPA